MHDVDQLQANTGKLSTSDATFATSLIRSYNDKGELSDKQWYWVDKLNERATQNTSTDRPADIQVGSFQGVLDLFANAASAKLKHPKIRLQLDPAHPVVLSIAGPNSRAPGTINVTDGGHYGSNTWYGRVNADGTWAPSSHARGDTQVSLTALLTALATDPMGVASEYGKLTGNCCFCGKGLDDPRSTIVGYGPICAKHYNLIWGGF